MLKKVISLFLLFWSSCILAQTVTDLEQAVNDMNQIVQQPYRFSAKQQACEKVVALAPSNTTTSLEASYYLTISYLEQHQQQAAKNQIAIIEQTLANTAGEAALQAYWVHWYYLKAKYANDITHNKQLALNYGLKAIFDATEEAPMFAELCLLMVDVFSFFGQDQHAKDFVAIYKMLKPFVPKKEVVQGEYYMGLAIAYSFMEQKDLAVKAIKKAMRFLASHHSTEKELVEEGQFLMAYLQQNEENFQIVEKIVNNGNRNYRYLTYLGSYYEENKIDAEKALEFLQGALVSACPEFKDMDIRKNPPVDGFFLDRGNLDISSIFMLKIQTLLGIAEQAESAKKAEEWIKLALKTGERATHIFSNWGDELEGFTEMNFSANEVISLMMAAQIVSAQALYDLTQAEEDLERMFYYMEQRKCLSLHHALTDSPLPLAIQQEKKTYQQQFDAYERQVIFASSEQEQHTVINEFTQFLREYEVFLEKSQKDYVQIRTPQADLQFLKAKEIQASLAEYSAFLQLSIADRNIYGILITKDGYQVADLSTLATGDEINNFIKSINHPLIVQKNKKRKFIKTSHDYYQQLLGPFEANLKNKKKLIISPDRELYNLPFELLLTTPAEKPFNELDFLIKDYEIEYQYSATLHQKIQQRPSPKDYSLLAFAPVFENGKGTGTADRNLAFFEEEFYSTSIQNDRFVPLPNSLREVETIRQLYAATGKVETLLHTNATKKKLANRLHQHPYHFVHIASHSIVNHLDFRASAVVCYEEEEIANLYFSGEFQALPIQADLVVLSSCESGIGLISEGEGLIGLNRSFIYAGAKNLLFSLWKVNDEHTANLMIDFYKNYKITEDYSQALRLAKLKMLANPITANPRFWAPFVLVGE